MHHIHPIPKKFHASLRPLPRGDDHGAARKCVHRWRVLSEHQLPIRLPLQATEGGAWWGHRATIGRLDQILV